MDVFTLAPFIFIIALLGTLISIKAIIRVSLIKHLFDEPTEERKIHITKTPNLGGLGMYCSFIFSISLIIPLSWLPYYSSFVAASMIIFSIGLKDDLVGLSPVKKIIGQLFASLIISYLGNIRITSLYGFLGIYEISFTASILLTIFICIVIYNSYNLIDGIDGLAGILALVAVSTFMVFFYLLNMNGEFLLSLAFIAIIIAFLNFNITPAKIFMGDTGSLFIGFMISLFTIVFLEANLIKNVFKAPLPIVLAILSVPVFDTIRVFLIRIFQSRSPFSADRNHLHHKFLKIGFSHVQSAVIIGLCTLVLILLIVYFQNQSTYVLLVGIIFYVLILNFFLGECVKRKNRK